MTFYVRSFILHISPRLCLVMIGFISVANATVAPIPKGIFCMPVQGANGFPDQILNDTRIAGLDLGDQWQDIETSEGVYDWSTLDTQLAQAEAHGKKVALGITSGGLNIPDWLLVELSRYTNLHIYRYQPIPWDLRTATYDTYLLGSDLSG